MERTEDISSRSCCDFEFGCEVAGIGQTVEWEHLQWVQLKHFIEIYECLLVYIVHDEPAVPRITNT